MNKLLFILLAVTMAGASCSPKLSPDHDWGNQRWVLIELKGVPVQQSGTRRDAYIEFSPSDKRFSGNGGCNRISGSYTLDKKNRISFGQVVSTKMSCEDISFENTFLTTLSNVDRYETSGNYLVIKKGGEIQLKLESRSSSN